MAKCPMCQLGESYQVRQADGKMQCKGCGTRFVDGDTPTEKDE